MAARTLETHVQTQLLQGRRDEKNFLIRHDEQYATMLHGSVAAAQKDLAALAQDVADQPALAAAVHQMAADTSMAPMRGMWRCRCGMVTRCISSGRCPGVSTPGRPISRRAC